MQLTRSLLALAIAGTLTACGGGSDDNKAPVFTNSSYIFSGDEDTVITGAVSASDEDPITYTVVNATSNGVFALNGEGSFTYTPNADFAGQDSATVQASDGSETAQATITFEVAAVNDAPELITTSISVTTSGETTTQLIAEDMDGDTITFDLVEGPENGLITLSSSGEINYIADQLEVISGAFTVSFTDNIIASPIIATIDLKASLATNEDRANFFYSSEVAYTQQSESYKALLDDEGRDEVNTSLAASYFAAGFDAKAESTVDEIDNIRSQAAAYRLSALEMDKRNQLTASADLRAKAEESYNIYLGQKGLDNINGNDAAFYLALNQDYLNAGQQAMASQLTSRIALYAEAVREEDYTTPWGNFVVAYANAARAEVALYLADMTSEQLERATAAVTNFAEIANKSGPSRGSERAKSADLGDAVEMFYLLGANELAKEYLAQHVALYIDANYDENHIVAASTHASTNLLNLFGFSKAPAMFAALYPGADTNIAYNLVADYGFSFGGTNFDLQDAQPFLYSVNIVNGMIDGNSVEEVMGPVEDYYLGGLDVFTMWDFFDATIETSNSDYTLPYAARILSALGYQSEGIDVLNRVSDVISSDSYVQTVGLDALFGLTTYITGRKGCRRLTELQESMGGDAVAQAEVCQTVVDTYYAPDSSAVSTSDVLSTQRDLMTTFNIVGDNDKIATAAANMQTAANSLDDLENRAAEQIDVASYALQLGLFEQSKTSLDLALATLAEMINSDDGEQIATAISLLATDLLLENQMVENSDRYGYMYGVRMSAAQIENYGDFYAGAMTAIITQVQAATTKALLLTEQEQWELMGALVYINHYTDQTQKVAELISNPVNADADKLTLQTAVAQYFALTDDLPGTSVASVDTDHDGLPNFFAADVTQAQIDESGLILDPDSDNDGIEDLEDTTPFGP